MKFSLEYNGFLNPIIKKCSLNNKLVVKKANAGCPGWVGVDVKYKV